MFGQDELLSVLLVKTVMKVNKSLSKIEGPLEGCTTKIRRPQSAQMQTFLAIVL